MTLSKPSVFVGSASEAKAIAQSLCSALSDAANMIPWWLAPEFQAGFDALDGLTDAINEYDFAVFLMTPADKIESRGKRGYSARDNVLFEYGLFLGKLGRERVFAFIEIDPTKKKDVKVPSDLAGITIPRFSASTSLSRVSTINVASEEVRKRIYKLGPRDLELDLIKTWGFELDLGRFSVCLSPVKLAETREKLLGKKLFLVAFKADNYHNDSEVTAIAIGNSRIYVGDAADDFYLIAEDKVLFADVRPDDRIKAYLMITDPDYVGTKCKTIADMKNKGARVVQVKGYKI